MKEEKFGWLLVSVPVTGLDQGGETGVGELKSSNLPLRLPFLKLANLFKSS